MGDITLSWKIHIASRNVIEFCTTVWNNYRLLLFDYGKNGLNSIVKKYIIRDIGTSRRTMKYESYYFVACYIFVLSFFQSNYVVTCCENE